jgi:hypothetical protein
LSRFRGHAMRRWSLEFDKEQCALADENYLARWGRRA